MPHREVLGVLAVLAGSAAVAVLALATAAGVTYLGGGSYRTEFISGWWWLAWLLVPVPVLVARRRPGAGLAHGAALVVPQYVAAGLCVARYRASGFGEGLEGLAFGLPLLLTLVTGCLVTGAVRWGAGSRGLARS